MAGVKKPPNTDDLIDTIYRAGVEPGGWQHVVDGILDAVGAHSGQMWLPALAVETGGLTVGRNVEATANLDYINHYHTVDLWNLRARQRGYMRCGAAALDGDLVSEKEWRSSEFWNDFLRSQDYYRLAVGVVDDGGADGSTFSAVACYRGMRERAFGERDRALLRRLLPHLRRAQDIQARLKPAGASAAELALDRLDIPVFAVTRDARIVFANSAGERLLRGTAGMGLHEGRLRFVDAEANRRLEEKLCHCAQGLRTLAEREGNVFVACDATGQKRWAISCVPASLATATASGAAVAVLWVRLLSAPIALASRNLEATYDLTRAEAALAAELANGATLEQHAKRRQVSLETTRTQLKAVMTKVGVSRQADLVRVLLAGHMPLTDSEREAR